MRLLINKIEYFIGAIVMIVGVLFAFSAFATGTTVYDNYTSDIYDLNDMDADDSGLEFSSSYDWSGQNGEYPDTLKIWLRGYDSGATYVMKAFIKTCTSCATSTGCSSSGYSDTTEVDGGDTGSEYTFTWSEEDIAIDDSKEVCVGIRRVSCSGGSNCEDNDLAYGIENEGGNYANVEYSGSSSYDVNATLYVGDVATDPRLSPEVTVTEPSETGYEDNFSVPYEVYTNVCYSEYPSETPVFTGYLQYDIGTDTWTTERTWEWEWDGVTINNGECLSYGLGAVGDELYIPFSDYEGWTWRLGIDVDFGSVTSSIDYSEEFNNLGLLWGDMLAETWGDIGTDTGSATGVWAEIMAYGSSTKPTCSVLGSSLFWDSSTVTGSGISCVWDWIAWSIWPTEDIDQLKAFFWRPMMIIKDKWPFSYITILTENFKIGWNYWSEDCPIPDMEANTLMSISTPSMDWCAPLDTLPDHFEDNPTHELILVYVIWLGAILGVMNLAISFLSK